MTPDALIIRSDVAASGSYIAVLELGRDHVHPIDAGRYGHAVLAAAERADYDAAVLRQLTDKGITADDAAAVIADLRRDRPPLDDTATAPLRFVPGVAQRDGRGFITLELDGAGIGQLDIDEARSHALHALGAGIAADLDAGYHHALRGIIGLDDHAARAAVADLAEYRPEAGR